MATYISYQAARSNIAKNKGFRWHKPNDALSATERLAEPMFTPCLGVPKFTFSSDSAFFMSGSCFARGLEVALSASKLNVLSLTTALDHWAVVGATPAGATNKYNLPSIKHEITWALGQDFPPEAISDLNNGTFFDPHMTSVFPPAPLAEIMEKREAMMAVAKRIFSANVVILTLGLTEVWRDDVTGLILNNTPHARAAAMEPDRYSFGNLTYTDNIELLSEIYDLLRNNCRDGLKIILTVSPVPLQATFSTNDVVQASTYSKSVLRAVSQDFADGHADVDYFPSYEIVMNSDRDVAWHEDLRHVRGEVGNHVMRIFMRHYMPDFSSSARTLLDPNLRVG